MQAPSLNSENSGRAGVGSREHAHLHNSKRFECTGTGIISSSALTRKPAPARPAYFAWALLEAGSLTILLPDFSDDIAFKLYVQK